MAKSPSKKVAFGFLEGAFFVQYFMDKLFCNRPCLFGFWLGVYLKNPRRCSILLKSSACCAACRETRHAAQGATAAHGDCLTRLFALVYVRVAVPASCGAPWTALAFCDRCPCFASLHPPQAALGWPFEKILRQIAHSSLRSSHTICRKISLVVSPSSAHVRRRRRILYFFDSLSSACCVA